MLFSNQPRTRYQKAPVHEVICQLRFPTILSISSGDPSAYQELIRDAFPQYVRRQDAMTLSGPNAPRTPVPNHHFLSQDGKWRLNLTQSFIALSTLDYPGWEAFAGRLDQPLAAFIEVYRPGGFQRVGLRYVNVVSRSRLGLDGVPWTELFTSAYTAPLREPDVSENRLLSCGCDLTLQLDSSCQARIHSGLGRIASQKKPDPNQEISFILDIDLSMSGSVSCSLAAAALETIHAHSTRIFEGAMSERLRTAIGPE
ncbi:MAG: TIGR04255 family protein [Oscillibacter sp.]|nr:TIGR04255 family protein [Oscillibacter sp.]